jgi:hypothetical protein
VAHYRSHKIVPSSSHSEGLLCGTVQKQRVIWFEPARISRVLSNIGLLFFQTREVAPCFWEIHRPSFSLFSMPSLILLSKLITNHRNIDFFLQGNLSRTPPSDMTVLETFRPGASMIYAESQILRKAGALCFTDTQVTCTSQH